MFGWSGVFRRQQRRLKPRAYAYRRKPGRDEQEREIQNTHNARKDARRNRFCVAPADPTLGKAGHPSIAPGVDIEKQRKAQQAEARADSILLGSMRSSF